MTAGSKGIGLVGTGIMGTPMAGNLLSAGYSLTVHSRTRSKAQGLLERGANWADSPAELASKIDTIITVVCDSPDVEQVYLAHNGICANVAEGVLCIDMSTVAPETARRVADALADRGGQFLDAPVSGGKTGAEAGTLAIMVGGDAEALDRARPIFDVLGGAITHCGPVGYGQLTKLCNQILCGLNLLAVSEAVVFARRVGLDPALMLKAVGSGAAGSWAVENLGPRMIARDFAPMFMVDLQQKDLRLALETGRRDQIPLPGTALVQQLLTVNQAHGEGREGTQALVKTLEKMADRGS
ncbi:MAG: NAD(P)-dependent oxidoreductase [Planctomycetes bacterium]|nr:NAD(P)-dependent oxidoreductase [Planctomycetota bacterium]